MPSLFLSYRRADSPDTVKLLRERLCERLPRWDVFYDHESIRAGEEFPEVLRQKVTTATATLVVVGPKWRDILHQRRGAVDHVRIEVRLALESGSSVVPVLVGNSAMPSDADLADFTDLQPLLLRNGRPVRPDPDFDNDLERIVVHLEQLDTSEAVGTILARKYTLTEELGSGGMGVVFAAQQKQPVKRNVAVKLIKPGMDSREILARFDAERQALAVMDHPNIAKVLDAGMTASSRPFFVMEFVHGVPITQYCDEKKLTVADRLRLFIPVCQAIQHAHQKSIIHRDLKPSNVLVDVADGKPTPKVIDFGVAKALGQQELTEKTLYTTLESKLGTPEYSAPEQLAGRSAEVDTRSDIYSLGVLLYELLSGALPFTRAELAQMSNEQIREVEPTKPSRKVLSGPAGLAANRGLDPYRLRRTLRGDLDWIVMKCLAREQARRYETANQVGDELQRYLKHEPVLAGPPTARYRAKKFLRRNRGLVIAATLVFLALLAGFVGTAVGLIRAKENLHQAVDAVENMLTKVAETDLENVPQMTPMREQLLMRAKDLVERLLAQYPGDATVRRAAGRVLLNLGEFYELTGNMADAELYYEKALEVVQPLAADFPGVAEFRQDMGRIYHGEAVAWSKGNDADKARSEKRFEDAIKLRQSLVDQNQGKAEYLRDLADSEYRRGALLAKLKGRTDEARLAYDQTLHWQRQLTLQEPNNPEFKAALARTLNNKGLLLWSLGEKKEAENLFKEATDLQTALTERFPGVAAYRLALARFYTNRAAVFWKDAPRAERSYKEAEKSYEELSKDFPSVPKYRQELAMTYTNLGRLWEADPKRWAEAAEAYDKALSLRKKLTALPDDRHKLAETMMMLGALHYKRGRQTEASDLYREAVQICEGLVADSPQVLKYRISLGSILNQLGRLLQEQGNLRRAQGNLRGRAQVCALAASHTSDAFLPGIASLPEIGVFAHTQRALAESKTMLERALEEHRQCLPADPENVRRYLRDDYVALSDVFGIMGQVDAACKWAEEIPKIFPDDNNEYARTARLLAGLLDLVQFDRDVSDTNRPVLIDRIGRRAVELLEQAIGKGLDPAQLRHPSYDPLRKRGDFQKVYPGAQSK